MLLTGGMYTVDGETLGLRLRNLPKTTQPGRTTGRI